MTLDERILEKIVEVVRNSAGVSVTDLKRQLRMPRSSVYRRLRLLVERQQVVAVGKSFQTRYVVPGSAEMSPPPFSTNFAPAPYAEGFRWGIRNPSQNGMGFTLQPRNWLYLSLPSSLHRKSKHQEDV